MRWALGLGLMLACGRPAVTSAPVEAPVAWPEHGPPDAKSECGLETVIPFLPNEQETAKVDAFVAQNGGRWKIAPEADMDGVFGYIRRATRLHYPKGDPKADPETVGRAFFEKNAAFLGFVLADIKRAKYMETGEGSKLTYDAPVPGLEGYHPPPLRIINVTFNATNGYVGGFYSMSSIDPLDFGLCARPPPPPTLRNVIGQDLFYSPHVYVQTEPPKPMGKVDLASITKREPVVCERLDDAGKHYVLGWRLVVERGGYAWTFTVSAIDGSLLERAD